jgi:transcriptional regulator with AAA-type ATPase domain
MKTLRNYKGKDVEMLIAVDTITDAAIANQDFLVSKRSNWKDPYLPNLKIAINKAIQDHLGQDNARELRNATLDVLALQSAALKDLAEVKVQIEADFDNNPTLKKEILNTLGFTPFYSKTKNKDQEALISLLYQFKTNLTPDLKAQIINKGTAEEQLDKITNYAEELKSKNVLQEGKKGTKKEITEEAIIAFNAVYNEAIAVAKISAKFFKDRPTIQEQFSYTKVKNNLNNTKPKSEPKP